METASEMSLEERVALLEKRDEIRLRHAKIGRAAFQEQDAAYAESFQVSEAFIQHTRLCQNYLSRVQEQGVEPADEAHVMEEAKALGEELERLEKRALAAHEAAREASARAHQLSDAMFEELLATA